MPNNAILAVNEAQSNELTIEKPSLTMSMNGK